MSHLEKDIQKIIIQNDSFAIASHTNPDSDAIGSCLALALALRKLQKTVYVLLEPFHDKNKIIPGQDLIWRGNQEPKVNVFIALDCGNLERLGTGREALKQADITITIDHHVSHKEYTQILYLDSKASSTCELIYRLITPIVSLDKDIASAIYAGMLTDTGGFRHPSTGVETIMITAELFRQGIPFTELYNELMRRHTNTEMLIFRTALNNLDMRMDGRIAAAAISAQEMSEVGGDASDTDGIAEYMLNIRGVEAAIFAYEKIPSQVKVSMRTQHIDASRIAAAFGGGGHIHAAGCSMSTDVKRAAELIIQEVIKELDNRP
ncbi:MAG: DHH family phosphoesterase [Clostridiales bacterium]|jgi:phosphoesterase RecJ-like protein|nr:DHH family phosphoesterase [Clostridiales bacterium]